MKCTRCKTEERHGQLAYCLPCNAAYLKEYRERKKAKMEEPIMTTSEAIRKLKNAALDAATLNSFKIVDKVQDRKSGVDRLYVHTGPNPKIKRCQVGFNGKACPNEGMPATVGEYKAWLCFAHSTMGKLVEV